MRKLKGLFARKEDIFKPRILSFREFCQYVYDPSRRLKSMNLGKDHEDEVREGIESVKNTPYINNLRGIDREQH
jgi:hypothetical protein